MCVVNDVKFELGMARLALAMDEVDLAALHTAKAEHLVHQTWTTRTHCSKSQLASQIGFACIARGVVIDDDLIRMDGQGYWRLTTPRMVDCPTHGRVIACEDVENGGCPVCSDEWHRELLADRDEPSRCWPYVE